MNKTSIEWTDATWNPTRGCSIVSPGCHNCFAMKMAHRFSGPGMAFEGLTKATKSGPQWTGKVILSEEKLTWPMRWKGAPTARAVGRPSRIFVNSMSDLFHESLRDEDIDRVFAVMALCPQHVFQVLTKRPARMKAYLTGSGVAARIADVMIQDGGATETAPASVKVYPVGPVTNGVPEFGYRWFLEPWPPANIWLGVSVENQKAADERIPLLLETPAAVRFLSVEPLLEAVDLRGAVQPYEIRRMGQHNAAGLWDEGDYQMPRTHVDWVIVGGESGPKARPFDAAWARSLRDQCATAGVPFFLKQMGSNPVLSPFGAIGAIGIRGKGGDMAEWSPDLRVREMPA